MLFVCSSISSGLQDLKRIWGAGNTSFCLRRNSGSVGYRAGVKATYYCTMAGEDASRPVRYHSGKPTILLTNDDGVDPEKTMVVPLGLALAETGLDVTVVAPGRNNSACGMSITIMNTLTLKRHPSYEKKYEPTNGEGCLRVFSILEGTPADCTAAAIEPGTGILAMLGLYPRLVVSGVNLGANLGTDVMYSGTVAGARQAALYGIPGVSTSLAAERLSRRPDKQQLFAKSIRATVEFVKSVLGCVPLTPPEGRLHVSSMKANGNGAGVRAGDHALQAFLRGDLFLNMNVPGTWDGSFTTTKLDQVLYRDIIRMDKLPEDEAGVSFNFVGSVMHREYSEGSDAEAVRNSSAAVTVIQTFPWSSPHWISEDLMGAACEPGELGLPAWIGRGASHGATA